MTANKLSYYMASCVSGQNQPNPALSLANIPLTVTKILLCGRGLKCFTPLRGPEEVSILKRRTISKLPYLSAHYSKRYRCWPCNPEEPKRYQNRVFNPWKIWGAPPFSLYESPLGEKSEYPGKKTLEHEHLRKSSLFVWSVILIRLTSEVICLFSLVDLCWH